MSRVDAVDRLNEQGPMPLAQLALRARNAKTGSAMLQNTVHYLGEAAAALAAAYWTGRALAGHEQATGAMGKQLAGLVAGPAFGKWVGLLRESASAVSGEALASLVQPLADMGPINAMVESLMAHQEAFGEEGNALARQLVRSRKRGVLGYLEFLVTFRNKVYGHGTMLPEKVCWKLAPLFLAGTCHVLNEECLFEGAWLGRIGIDLFSDERERYWRRLQGGKTDRVSPSEAPPEPALHSMDTLYMLGPEGPISLAFLVIQQEDATGLSRFGFYHGTRGRALEFIDYLKGSFTDDSLLALRDELVGRLRETVTASSLEPGSEAPAAPAAPAAGERQFGDFIVDAELGRGAMGIVYRATQQSLGRRVALKVLPRELSADPVARGRFEREIRSLGQCDHPNVVRVLASGIEEDRPWFAMELVDGADLAAVFTTLQAWSGENAHLSASHLSAASSSASRSRPEGEGQVHSSGEAPSVPAPPASPPLPEDLEQDDASIFERLALLFAEAALGLEKIHRHGLIHRDIKPSNLMLTGDGQRLVVMDLGLAKDIDSSANYTQASGDDFVGSARYAAPEQIQARLLEIDHRVDIYSLGATLYELCTLSVLYPADSIPELLQRKLNQDPAPAREVSACVPADLETVLLKAMAREPDDRYRSAAALADDLRAFAEGRPIAARPPSAFDLLRLFYRRERKLVRLGMLSLLLVIGIIVVSFVLVTHQRNDARFARDAEQTAREEAERLKKRAEEEAHKTERARDWAYVLMVRQMNSGGHNDPGTEALLLRERSALERLPGWMKIFSQLAVHRIPRRVIQHGAAVLSVAWSPDGQRFVTASKDRTARVWSLAVTKPVRELVPHEGAVTHAAWSPDGKRLVTVSEEAHARLWEVDTDNPPIELPHDKKVRFATWSPDGRWVATMGNDHRARIWPADGKGDPIILEHARDVVSGAFSPDSKRLATGEAGLLEGPQTARIWEFADVPPGTRLAADKSRVFSLHSTSRRVHRVAWSPDGKLLAMASGHTAQVFHADGTGEAVVRKPGRWVWTISWSPDGTHLAVGADRDVWIWPALDKAEPLVLNSGSAIKDVAWSPDGRFIATASLDKTARIWRSEGHHESQAIVLDHTQTVHQVRWSPDGSLLLTGSDDGTARVWSSTMEREAIVLEHKDTRAHHAAWNPVAEVLAVVTRPGDRSPGTLGLWTLTGSGEPRLLPFKESLWHAAWSPDGKTLALAAGDYRPDEAVSPPGTLYLLDVDEDKPRPLLRFDQKLRHVAWSPDGRFVAGAANDGTVRIVARDGQGDPVVLRHRDWVYMSAWHPTKPLLATASEDKTTRLWDTTNGKELARLRHDGDVETIQWSCDGTSLLSACIDGHTRIWDPFAEKIIADFDHEGRQLVAAWSPDCRFVASGGRDRRVTVWSVEEQKPVRLLPHESWIRDLSWSPDGNHLAVGCDDHSLQIWDLQRDIDPLFYRLGGTVWSTSWMPGDNGRVIAASHDGAAYILPVISDPDEWLWSNIQGCLSVSQRVELLTETEEEAQQRYAKCQAAVSEASRSQ